MWRLHGTAMTEELQKCHWTKNMTNVPGEVGELSKSLSVILVLCEAFLSHGFGMIALLKWGSYDLLADKSCQNIDLWLLPRQKVRESFIFFFFLRPVSDV